MAAVWRCGTSLNGRPAQQGLTTFDGQHRLPNFTIPLPLPTCAGRRRPSLATMAPPTLVYVLLAALVVAAVAVAAPAVGHVTINPKKAPTSGHLLFKIRLPHDCGDKTVGTSNITVTLPPGVVSVKQEQVAGWLAIHKMKTLDPPIVSGSSTYTETMETATWVGFLPDGMYREFGLSVKLLPQADGTVLYWKAVQDCHGGEAPRVWDQIPTSPCNATRLAHPAPKVELIEGYEA